MLVTMKNSELIDKLVLIADGSIDLVQDAIRASAGTTMSADLKDIVEYIVAKRKIVRRNEDTSITPARVAPAEKEMIDEKSITEAPSCAPYEVT